MQELQFRIEHNSSDKNAFMAALRASNSDAAHEYDRMAMAWDLFQALERIDVLERRLENTAVRLDNAIEHGNATVVNLVNRIDACVQLSALDGLIAHCVKRDE